MSDEEDIFKVISDFMKGKSGPPNMTAATLSWDGCDTSEIPKPPSISQTYSEFAQEYSTVVSGLSRCSFGHCAALIGSMLTLPEFQSNAYRLMVLAHLAAMFARGKDRPSPAQIAAWFNQLDRGTCGRQEDPAEDLFISNVHFGHQNYRLFNGTCEGNAFYTQLFLNILGGMPDQGSYLSLKRAVVALLTLSEEVANRADLPRNSVGNTIPASEIKKPSPEAFRELRRRVVFTSEQISELGISAAAIAPFVVDQSDREILAEYNPGLSPFEFKPVVMDQGKYVLCLPDLVGITIRELVIRSCSEAGMLNNLESSLANEHALWLNDASILGDLKNAPVSFSRYDPFHASNMSIEIDAGKYLHLLLFVDGFVDHEKGMFLGVNPIDPISQFVEKSISDVSKEYSSTEGFRDGLTLIIGCGWGRSLGLQVPEANANWRIRFLSAHDLAALSGAIGLTALDIWRTADAEDALKNMNIDLLNANGLLNLYSWISKNNGHIIPHEKLDPNFLGVSGRALLNIPLNSLLDLRQKVAQGRDEHVATRPDGTVALVRRVNGSPRYGTKELSPFYADVEALNEQVFRSVYEGAVSNYWAMAHSSSALALGVKFQLSNMVMNWAEATFRFLDSRGVFREGESFSCSFEFLDIDVPMGGLPLPTEEEIAALVETTIDPDNGTANFLVRERFLNAGQRIDNLAERQIVLSLIRECLNWSGKDASHEEIQGFADAVMRGNDARHFHAFSVPDLRDFVRDTLPSSGLIIEKMDDANSRLNLGWLARDRKRGGEINGLPECQEYLRELVSAIIKRIKTNVSNLNREQLIKMLMVNHEALFMEMTTWRRTFNAVRALSEEPELAMQQAGEKIAQFNAASMGSRIVAEVALCESPLVGGMNPGKYDLAKLLADASLVFHMGGFSDAMSAEMMSPEIRISPAGDVMMNHDFTDSVVRPFGEMFQSISLEAAATNYAKNYEDPTSTTDDSEAGIDSSQTEGEFEAAWLEEFGFSTDEAKEFVQGFHNLLDEKRSAVFVEKLDPLVRRLSESIELEIEVIEKIADAFSLKPRPRWDEVPQGVVNSSWFPWRFQRQLSLVSKPIIQLENQPNPKCVIVPAMVIQNLAKFYSDARFGTVDQKMFNADGRLARWIGKINGHQGEAFNEQVATQFTDSGWEARANLSDGEILGRKKIPGFGDVDVLAWLPMHKRVAIIECKDLSMDKTPGEIARRLSNFRGLKKSNGKRDDLLKHLDRCETLDRERDSLAKFLGFEVDHVEKMIVTSAATPIQFSESIAEHNVTIITASDIQRWTDSITSG